MVAVEPDIQVEVEPEDDFPADFVLYRGEQRSLGDVESLLFALDRLNEELEMSLGEELSPWAGPTTIPDSPSHWIAHEQVDLWRILEELL
jgi:hypothetical protein